MGEELPRGPVKDWARWIRSRGYLLSEGEAVAKLYARLTCPMTGFSIDDDHYAPRQTVDALYAIYASAPVERIHLRPKDLGVKSLGHFRCLPHQIQVDAVADVPSAAGRGTRAFVARRLINSCRLRPVTSALFVLVVSLQLGAAPEAEADAGVTDLGVPDGGLVLPDAGTIVANEPPPDEWVKFEGNKLLPDALYLNIIERNLRLPPHPHPSVDLARSVELTLTRFLHEAGYELALVHAARVDDLVMVSIDEGAMEKIVFRGRLNLQTVRLAVSLDLPHLVFNRSTLDKQLQGLTQTLGLSDMRYELVPTAEVRHVGPQLPEMPAVAGYDVVYQRREVELHFILPEHEWDTGLGADLRIGYVDGIEFGLNYQGRDGLFSGDRWRVEGAGGIGLRNRIDGDALYANFSRALVNARYVSPPLIGKFKLVQTLRGELLSRQRRDLGLETYNAMIARGATSVEIEPREGIRIAIGGGFEFRRFFAYKGAFDDTPVPPVANRFRPFILTEVDLTFDPQNNRWDRHHRLQAQLWNYFGIPDSPAAGKAVLQYQYVKAYGWHDLWVRARAYAAWQDVSVLDEVSVGEFIRGGFGAEFVRRITSGGVEFRFSLSRDLIKLAVFTDWAVFTETVPNNDLGPARVAGVIGPGLNLLVAGLLQMDFYLAFGWRSQTNSATVAISALLQKAF